MRRTIYPLVVVLALAAAAFVVWLNFLGSEPDEREPAEVGTDE